MAQRVAVYDSTGIYLREYPSIVSAAAALHVAPSTVKKYLNTRTPLHGYYYKSLAPHEAVERLSEIEQLRQDKKVLMDTLVDIGNELDDLFSHWHADLLDDHATGYLLRLNMKKLSQAYSSLVDDKIRETYRE